MVEITQKSYVTLFPLWSLKKTEVGYIDLKQQETYEKLENRGWYSKWYWYFNNATTNVDYNTDDNSPASTVTATATVTTTIENIILTVISCLERLI